MKMGAPIEGVFILSFIAFFGGLCFLVFLFKVGYYVYKALDQWAQNVPIIGGFLG